MSGLLLVLLCIGIFIVAYVTYGAWLCKKWGVDPKRTTPAHEVNDGIEYVPAKAPVVFGHHFASIAGSGPIVGPIGAVMFGWLPATLWIIIGGIFFGGVHDFGSLLASIRHKGKTIGKVIEANVGVSGKKLFSMFAWLTTILVIAAFMNIVADTFVGNPAAATSSVLFVFLAVIFGFFVYRKGVSLVPATIIGVAALFGCVWLGTAYPIMAFSKTAWIVILTIYVFIAAVLPVWTLLQPRDYLNSYLLYVMIAGAVVGLIFYRPELQLEAVTSFNVNGSYMFPILFVTVACGAISGFHSLVASGTTSKQISNEKDARTVGYGGMLVESTLAIIAIVTAAYLSKDALGELMANGGPVTVFSNGVGTFMSAIGIPLETGVTFTALAISAFALTTLDTTTRLSRFIFNEMFEDSKTETLQKAASNRYVSTGLTLAASMGLVAYGYAKIWPIFGSANQLLAAIALLAIAVWLKNSGKSNKMIIAPMIFMFAVTLSALVLLFKDNIQSGSIVLAGLAVVLFVLALMLIKQAYGILRGTKEPEQKQNIE